MADVSLTSTSLSAGIGAVVAFLGAAGKSYLDSRRAVDKNLREQRAPAYQNLWQKTRLFENWPRPTASYGDAEVFQQELADWYYEGGGLYLSRASQRAYVKLQKSLARVLQGGDKPTKMTDADWSLVRGRCSTLRARLTADLLSRRSGRGIL